MSVEVSEQKSIEKVVTGMPTSDARGCRLLVLSDNLIYLASIPF